MSSLKQFLLSILATTVSIALTFGTAAIIDSNKKEKEKREIVMMVMYDMHNSLQSVEKADSMFRQFMRVKRKIAEDTTKFDALRFQLANLLPKAEYTETIENIFSSSIETINTVGNVIFTEKVAEFYQKRNHYKTTICDSISKRLAIDHPFTTANRFLDFSISFEALMTAAILESMHQQYLQCKQMMDISDEEIDAYRRQRQQIEQHTTGEDAADELIDTELVKLINAVEEARKKSNLK